MKKQVEKIVLPNSPEAAQRKQVTAWVARDGGFWSDDEHGEHMARFCGSTHNLCTVCGTACEKSSSRCASCQAEHKLAQYAAMPRAAWDGVQMLYSEAADRFFSDFDEIQEHIDELDEPISITDMRLVLCEPQYARQLDIDYYVDELPGDDGDWHSLPTELQDAIEAYNKVAAACLPLSWTPGKFALDTSEKTIADGKEAS